MPEKPDVADSRARYEKMAVLLGGAPDAKVEKVDAGGVPAEWVAAPGFDAARGVLYLHGGGYAIGSLHTHPPIAHHISPPHRAPLPVVARRPPAPHPFP